MIYERKTSKKCFAVEIITLRLVIENRLGLRCNSYFTFHVSGRDRGSIFPSVGKLCVRNLMKFENRRII